jgi:hypothetical protein
MRRFTSLFLTCTLLLAVNRASQAGGEDASAIINKAIKAQFGSDKEAPKQKGYRGKNKGTLYIGGMELEFTQEIAMQGPDKFKDVMTFTVGGMNIEQVTVFNGKEGWIKGGGKEIKAEKEILEEFKDVASLLSISQGVFTKDKGLKYSVIGDATVNDKPAVGVKITREGKKPVDMYFDKETGLIAKIERIKTDLMTNKEVTEERIILEYQEIGGRKHAKKVEVKVDGKKLLDVELLESQFLDKVEDSEFVRPQ